ncbi:hypothetical protein [Bacillus dakarensis]|nr:hypothetical protein [Bacillus dakarensis]
MNIVRTDIDELLENTVDIEEDQAEFLLFNIEIDQLLDNTRDL